MADTVDEHARAQAYERGLFTDTLSHRNAHPVGLRTCGPVGVAAHAVALGALVIGSLYSAHPNLSPRRLTSTILQFAPPPPPPQNEGLTVARSQEAASAFDGRVRRASIPIEIPNEVLTPTFELGAGFPMATEGFESGNPLGLAAGLRDGVVGGVPSGTVGGVIGGTGTSIPQFPTPDVGPRPIRMPKARFSAEAIRQNVTGSVRLLAVIDEQGNVKVLEVTRSIPELDAIAIRTVESSWRFEPATKKGRPISCVSNLVVRFNLR